MRKLFTTAISALLMAVMFATPLPAQFTRPTTGARVYLVTAGPGGDFESWWGHAAIVIASASAGRDYWYDYGIIEAVAGPGALRGKLRARVIRSGRPQQMLRRFLDDDRSVRVQQLYFSDDEIASLQSIMESDVHRFGRVGYEYRHITDNCTTRIRDVIDRVSGGALRAVASSRIAPQTVREDGYRRLVARSVLLTSISDVLTGRTIDQPMSDWDAMFLPQELAAKVASAKRVSGEPLATDIQQFPSVHHLLAAHPPVYNIESNMLVGVVVLIVLTCAIIARHGSGAAHVILGGTATLLALVFGITGLVLTYSWFFTDYTFTQSNENILLANPLLLLTLPFAVAYAMGSRKALVRLSQAWAIAALAALFALALKAVPMFNQMNWRVIRFIVPITISMSLSLWIARQPRRTNS